MFADDDGDETIGGDGNALGPIYAFIIIIIIVAVCLIYCLLLVDCKIELRPIDRMHVTLPFTKTIDAYCI